MHDPPKKRRSQGLGGQLLANSKGTHRQTVGKERRPQVTLEVTLNLADWWHHPVSCRRVRTQEIDQRGQPRKGKVSMDAFRKAEGRFDKRRSTAP